MAPDTQPPARKNPSGYSLTGHVMAVKNDSYQPKPLADGIPRPYVTRLIANIAAGTNLVEVRFTDIAHIKDRLNLPCPWIADDEFPLVTIPVEIAAWPQAGGRARIDVTAL